MGPNGDGVAMKATGTPGRCCSEGWLVPSGWCCIEGQLFGGVSCPVSGEHIIMLPATCQVATNPSLVPNLIVKWIKLLSCYNNCYVVNLHALIHTYTYMVRQRI